MQFLMQPNMVKPENYGRRQIFSYLKSTQNVNKWFTMWLHLKNK